VSTCKHTPCPSGYVNWHMWAEQKDKTHDQHRCPACGRWRVWRKRADTKEEA
jgi:ribosomal protein L37AE/L43A